MSYQVRWQPETSGASVSITDPNYRAETTYLLNRSTSHLMQHSPEEEEQVA